MDHVRARVLVSGRVQGVNFRAATSEQARGAGVAGWVRNLPDGRVEAVFEGPRAAVGLLLGWCQHGPRWAHVEQVELAWEAPQGEQGFRVTEL